MEAHTKKIMSARTALVLDQPFFGVLALRLRIVADPSCKRGWVDGRSLGYNPTWVESQTHAQLVGFLAHEVMHCACGHPWRRSGREMKKWNSACDHAINPILVDANFTLPENVLLSDENRGKSAEWIYDRLPDEQGGGDGSGEGGDSGAGDDQPGSGAPGGDDNDDQQDDGTPDDQPQDADDNEQGEVRDAPADSAEDGSTEADWSVAVQQAANQAAAQGKLPAELERFAEAQAQPKVDWRSVLRRFVQEVTQADYSWKTPNRRYMAQGMYLPALHAEGMGSMLVAIDTSMSVDDVLLGQFEAELRAIVSESNPARVHVVYCDAKVKRIDTFERDDVIEINAKGGGGTAFGPVFDAINAGGVEIDGEYVDLSDTPVCAVYLTDLMGSFPSYVPDVPTLWATTIESEVPFGEVLPIE